MVNFFWFRRDLRLEDNTALQKALGAKNKVIPLFIFDTNILDELANDDSRVNFIYTQLAKIHEFLKEKGSGLLVKTGTPQEVWQQLIKEYSIEQVFYNRDYEPYAIKRDNSIKELLQKNNISCLNFKDQVIFESDEILKADNSCYTVFTPYKNKWLSKFELHKFQMNDINWQKLSPLSHSFPTLNQIGFKYSSVTARNYNLTDLSDYAQNRNVPAIEGTSNLSVHLRFGTVSIRKIIEQIKEVSPEFLSELIWREFFMQILHSFPRVVNKNFKVKYNGIQWRNNMEEFRRWCNGETGYPFVDAGMRELNQTGYMHNRVRMVVASFLCKHLLIDWRWGEAYFANKLLDYELSSNNGNWQWAAGTGCDAAPYFRIFNPIEQQKKFDSQFIYIKKWIPELESYTYPKPMVDHKEARERALRTYKKGISQT